MATAATAPAAAMSDMSVAWARTAPAVEEELADFELVVIELVVIELVVFNAETPLVVVVEFA